MDTFVSANQYDELIRKSIKKERLTLVYVFAGIAFFELILSLFLSGFTNEGFDEIGIYFLIPIGVLSIVAIVFFFLARNVEKADFVHFTYDRYRNYRERKFKHPLFRIRHYGKSSETIYQILDLDEESVKIIDLKKTKDEVFIDATKDIVSFQFLQSTNNGLYPFKSKIHLRIRKKLVVVYGFKENNERFYNYLKNEGYEVSVK